MAAPLRYLVTATDPGGRRQTLHVRAATPEAARESLERGGYTDITFYDSHFAAGLQVGLPALASAQDELNQRLRPPSLLRVVASHAALVAVGAGFSIHYARRGDLGAWEIGVVVATVLYALVALLVTLPLKLHDVHTHARRWGRRERARRTLAWLRRLTFWLRLRVVLRIWDYYEAMILASEGKLDAARSLLERRRADTPADRKIHACMLPGLHEEAGDWAGAAEAHQRACAMEPQTAGAWIDHARFLALRALDAGAARAALERAGDLVQTPTERAYVEWVEGMIAALEGDGGLAVQKITAARAALFSTVSPTVLHGIHELFEAVLCLAYAAAGRMDEARAAYANARPLLEATRDEHLDARCRQAIGAA